MAAYRGLLEQDKVPLAPIMATQLQAHIERIARAGDLSEVEPLRNPWLE